MPFKVLKVKTVKESKDNKCVCVCVCVCVKSLQLCPTLCNLTDCSSLGSSVHGILQARILRRLPSPPSGDLPDPGIEQKSLMSPVNAGRFFTTSATGAASKTINRVD